MIFRHKRESITRLLKKVASTIGPFCEEVTDEIIHSQQASSVELEILERLFTMGFYDDDCIEGAAELAIAREVSSAVEFLFLVCEVSRYDC